MTLSSNTTQVTALSPLDGRYAAKLAQLRPLMSEQGYMHRRVQVELAWFVALSDAGFTEFSPLSNDARQYLIRSEEQRLNSSHSSVSRMPSSA